MDPYEDVHMELYEILRARADLSPQVAGRKLSKYYRASVRRVAALMYAAAEEDLYTEEQREHLQFAAKWMGFKPKEGA